MSVLQIICWWLAGFGCGISFWNVFTKRHFRQLDADREAFFDGERAKFDALVERQERRYQDLRKRLGMQPEGLQ